MAVDVLKSKGVPEDRILFINLIASPEGVTSFATRFPKLRVVTAFVDQGLDEKKYVPAQTKQEYPTDSCFQLYRSGTGRLWGSVLYSVKGSYCLNNLDRAGLTGPSKRKVHVAGVPSDSRSVIALVSAW